MAEVAEVVKEVAEVVKEVEVSDEKLELTTSDNSDVNSSSDAPKEETDKTESESKEKDVQDIAKLEADIIRQVEYYFGDENLRRDKFLMEKISEDKEGWVPFSILLKFKRLAALSTETEIIANALMKSESGVVEVSEDKTKIRRHPENPIPEYNEERRKEIISRSAYVKGFPLDIEMSDLIEFFLPFEKVLNIIMRKYLDKPSKKYKFKGSVFVTFAKKEQCEEFINKEKVEYKGKELIKKWQDQYTEEKKKEEGKHKKQKKEEKDDSITLPKGAILYFENSGENTKREDIREGLHKFAADVGTEIAFIEYSQGNPSGNIRLSTEDSAQPLLDKLQDKKLKLNEDTELVFRTLTEEEETEYLKKTVMQMKSRRNQQTKKHRGNRKRKLPGSEEECEPKLKQKN